jgi:hypothetical protein
MILLDENQITNGAEYLCDGGPPQLAIFSADCDMYNCTCCNKYCCHSGETCYDDQDLLANMDLQWETTFSVDSGFDRDSWVFSENIEFRPVTSENV